MPSLKASAALRSTEALLRWRHPTRGLVEPSEFIPLAEELGLINEIGEWVFREAALWAERFSRHTMQPFQISVNKSPMQFGARPPVTSWPDQLKAMQLPCRSISIEITEGVLLQDSRVVIDTLHDEAGCDFGQGYLFAHPMPPAQFERMLIDRREFHVPAGAGA